MYNFSDISNVYVDMVEHYNAMSHSRYTTSIRNLVYDSIINGVEFGYDEPIKCIEQGRKIIFDFEYPINNSMYESELLGVLNPKDIFEIAFISKYFTDEIGFESLAEFKMKLRGRLMAVIPIFNLKFNVLANITLKDFKGGFTITETINNEHYDTRTDDLQSKNNSENTRTDKNISSNFPVNYIDDYDELEGINYGSNGNSAISENTSESTIKNTGTQNNNGSYETTRTLEKIERMNIEKFIEFRNKFDNIINDTLNEFNNLFMAIY